MKNKVNFPIVNLDTKLSEQAIGTAIAPAIKLSDREILEFARSFPVQLSNSHRARFDNWQPVLFYHDDTLIRYQFSEFTKLNILQKHLEILRAEAEAYLIHHNLGFIELAEYEKNRFLHRALGILPDNKEDRFFEILTCPGYKPAAEVQNLVNDTDLFKQKLLLVKKEFGQSTALAIGLLIQSGAKFFSEFEYYGQKLDFLLRKIANLPQIQKLLEQRRIEDSFNNQFVFLSTLHDRMHKYLPKRKVDDKNIFLTDILDKDWDNNNEISGSEVVFTSLDCIVLSRFGFETNCVHCDGKLCLEIITSEKTLYWEPLSNSPLSFTGPVVKYIGDFTFLISQTFIKMANFYFQMRRDFTKTIDLYHKAIELTPNIPGNYANLAQVYIKSNYPRQAIENLKKALELQSDSAEYHHLLGIVYCLVEEWEQAISHLQTALTLQPNRIEILNNLAYCYEQTKEARKAEDIYFQILALKPDYFEASFGIGNVYLTLKLYDRAIYYYQQTLRLNPASEHCLYNLAQTYYINGDIQESIKTYQELLKINPNHAAGWYNLGIIYRDTGNQDEAIKCIERAIRLNPNLMK